MNATEKKKIVVHDGIFHADDVFAVAALRIAHDDVVVVRSRDPEETKDAHYVVDVGAQCTMSRGRLDHHQWNWQAGEGLFHDEEKTEPMASFGLTWEHRGGDAIADLFPEFDLAGGRHAELEMVWERVRDRFVRGIDAADTGSSKIEDVRFTSVSAVISSFNPPWNAETQNFDSAFESAVNFAVAHLCRVIVSTVAWMDARAIVDRAVAKAEQAGSRLLLLESYCPWQEHLGAHDFAKDVSFVVYPQGDDWMIFQVPVNGEGEYDPGSFAGRVQFPETWAGLRDEELAEASGVASAVFVHGGRFCGGAKSRRAAREMAEIAIEMAS